MDMVFASNINLADNVITRSKKFTNSWEYEKLKVFIIIN